MAKQIKTIKCPQCGSTDKTEIKPDFFRCNNCNTEYFLDNDDVNINYNHNFTVGGNRPNFQTNAPKNALRIIYFILIGFVIFGAIMNWFFSGSKSKTTARSVYSTVSETSKEKEFRASRYLGLPIALPGSDKVFIVYVEERSYSSDSDRTKNGIYAAIYTPTLKELVSEQKIGDDKLSGSNVKIRKFENGIIYLIANKTTVYILDPQDLKFKEAGKQIFGTEPNLQVGIATVDFTYNGKGDGLIIMTNDGKDFTYFPAIKKLYTKDQLYKASQGFNTLPPGAKESTYYTFTSKSFEYPEEKTQLLRITFKDYPGGPKDMYMSPSWSKDYGRSGIFTDRDPYKKVLFNPYRKANSRVLTWKDLTPGRLYFEPVVLFYDDQNLIIQFRNSANPEAPKSIQKLNINTGAIEWTLLIDKSDIDTILATKTGFIAVKGTDETMAITKDGKLTGTYKFD